MDAPLETPDHAVLDRFSDAVRAWFLDAFAAPTPLQERAWEAIEGGENALVIAPTGSGKTLAAFLFAIDALMQEKAGTAARPAGTAGASKAAGAQQSSASRAAKGVRVLYVSPLKALGADVERNLQEPLAGIAARLAGAGGGAPAVRTGMRTGDTPPDQRRALVRNPPDILITTPESLYLMLTSQAREVLRCVETVIVDEVHALAGDKRGAHLALSLERLDDLLERPAQRIGLSATVSPRDEIARFLGGAHPVRIVASDARPRMDVRVSVPVRDMVAIPAFGGFDADGTGTPSRRGHGGGPRRAPVEEAWKSDRALRRAMARPDAASASPDSRMGSSSIWPYIESAILDQVLAHRTTIVFVNSRGLCEKLTARLNELYAKRRGVFPAIEEGAPAVGMRSDMGSTADLVQGTDEVIAKAHHGSVSKEKRLQVEHELKCGQLPCVVATSSLELGIDMGSIDLVLQVAAPPSVASGLQRIGRANHQVGGRSEGVMYPRTRTEVIDAAVVAEGMAQGRIEKTAIVRNPLDVLAQQTVAAVAMDDVAADAWYATVRRAAPFSQLPRRAFDSVLDMLSGRHASGDLTDFRPRIVWDRESGLLSARPGAQRQAVVSAGTIPDRGMFSVVLPEAEGNQGRRRVGELDEEMVYESRVGDIIALGTSTWRISEITSDRVIVEPAPGRSARLPFWHGEAVGRPAETGKMRGAFLRFVAAGIGAGDDEGEGGGSVAAGLAASAVRPRVDKAVLERLEADGLDADAQANLVELIRVQREATGVVPDDRTLVVERCEDETGDWRVMLHSPYGRRVHEPWAMAVTDRVARLHGFDPQTAATDDGIVLRVPMTETRLPGAELFVFDPDELDRIVRDRVDSTSLFAARFRECAARALLMSPSAPGKRAPLWQQRIKGGQLLEAARRERDFPILAEAARECLQDVYDLPALHELMEGVQTGVIRLVEAQTTTPSPFAAPLLFGYVGEHLYDGDLPHAERRASLLSLDPALLGELLGTADLAQLLDPDVARTLEANLQRTSDGRRAHGAEGVADLVRALGPLSVEEVAARLEGEEVADSVDSADGEPARRPASADAARAALDELHRAHRVFPALIGGVERWASVDDARRLRDALGTVASAWALATFTDAGDAADDAQHPLDELVARYARTHGPFATEALAVRLGVGRVVARESLERLVAEGRLMQGRFGSNGESAEERSWVSPEVFKRLRLLSLAKARKAVRAVGSDAYVRYLFDLQGVGPVGGERFEGVEGVAQVIAQFEGVFLPAGAWEEHVLPSRVRDFRPAMLDELLASGDVVWAGSRRDAGNEADVGKARGRRTAKEAEPLGLVAFYPTDSPFAPAPAAAGEPGAAASRADESPSDGEGGCAPAHPSVEEAVVEALGGGYGLFFRQIVESARRALAPEVVDEAAVANALQDLVWSGRATNDTFAPIRSLAVGGSASKPRAVSRRRVSSRRSRTRYAEAEGARTGASAWLSAQGTMGAALSGRWSLIAPSPENDTVRAIGLVESILDRYGVLARDVVLLSGVPGGMGSLFPVLRSMEDAGEVLRGAFVEGLGPAQFASRETVDLLRTYAADDRKGEGEAEAVEGRTQPETVVLAADDPACLFGAGLPWPPAAGGAEADDAPARPTRRAGSLVVVRGGRAVLYATAGLRNVTAFTAEGDALAEAVCALVTHATRAMKRVGSEGARKKLSVETFNGAPVLGTPFADVLQEAGFVRLPDGMRLYVSPF